MKDGVRGAARRTELAWALRTGKLYRFSEKRGRPFAFRISPVIETTIGGKGVPMDGLARLRALRGGVHGSTLSSRGGQGGLQAHRPENGARHQHGTPLYH